MQRRCCCLRGHKPSINFHLDAGCDCRKVRFLNGVWQRANYATWLSQHGWKILCISLATYVIHQDAWDTAAGNAFWLTIEEPIYLNGIRLMIRFHDHGVLFCGNAILGEMSPLDDSFTKVYHWIVCWWMKAKLSTLLHETRVGTWLLNNALQHSGYI